VKELLCWVRFPSRRFPTAGDHDTRTVGGATALAFDGCGKVHVQRHQTQNALGVIDQMNELTQTCFAAQVENSGQRGMIVMRLTHLDEENSSLEMIDNRLPSTEVPPLNSVIKFSAGHDDPIGNIQPDNLCDDRRHALFGIRKVNIASKRRGFDPKVKLLIQVLDKPVKEMNRSLIRELNQRIMTFQNPDPWITGLEGNQIRIVVPQVGTGCSDIRHELVRIALMEVAHGSREHYDVTGRLEVE